MHDVGALLQAAVSASPQPAYIYDSLCQLSKLFLESLCCRVVSMDAARIVVYPVFYTLDLLIRRSVKVCPLRNLPSYHLIGYFIRSPLPAAIRVTVKQFCPFALSYC